MKRKGYVLLMVVFGAVSLAFFGFSVSSLNQGYRSQVLHTKQMQASFQIAYSGFQRILAKTFLKPWEERFFKATPGTENGVVLYGGVYDSFVFDAPGQKNQADIYIRVKLEEVTRNYVWRVEHVPDLLDSQYYRTIFFGDVPINDYPAGSAAAYSNTINQKMQDRATNRPKAESLANQIAGLLDLKDIANLLGTTAPSIPGTNSLPAMHAGILPPSISAPVSPPSGMGGPGADSLLNKPIPKLPYPTADEWAKLLDDKGRGSAKRVAFKPDSAVLTGQSDAALDELAKLLKSRPTLKIVIEGHTADAISAYTGPELSMMRAKSVFDYLKAKGIPTSQMDTVGRGDSVPIATNATEAGRAKNRRVEIVKLP